MSRLADGKTVKRAILGAAVGDAFGVPYEGMPRRMAETQVTDAMRGWKRHLMPKGIWSDDTAMLLATADGIGNGLHTVEKNYVAWFLRGKYMPPGIMTYDVGMTTRDGLMRVIRHKRPTGNSEENASGNGSLMRILPAAIYLQAEPDIGIRRRVIRAVSSVTHASETSVEGCVLYCELARILLAGGNLDEAYREAASLAESDHIETYARFAEGHIPDLPREDVHSDGYVVSTLEAAIWCLFRGVEAEQSGNDPFLATVRTAVALGFDTDTTACVAGGLAGILWPVTPDLADSLKGQKVLQTISARFADSIPETPVPIEKAWRETGSRN